MTDFTDALCREVDGDLWFPEAGGNPNPAKRICNGDGDNEPCPLRDACLAYALASPEALHGIWGGLTVLERQRLRKRSPRNVPIHRESIAQLTAEGLTSAQIATRLGITERTVERNRSALNRRAS